MTKERATYLCTNSQTVDCHCAVRPFRGIPPLVRSTGHAASRSCKATTNSRLSCVLQCPLVQFPLDGILLSCLCSPFVGPVGTASCCTLRGPDGVLSPLRWTSTHLHRCMENAGWSSRRLVPFLSIFSPWTSRLSSVSERCDDLTSQLFARC